MLPRKFSLVDQKDIATVIKKGRGVNTEIGLIKIYRNQLIHPRFVFIVSGKVSRKSTERHLIRRRLRAAAHQLIADFKNNCDIAFIARKEIINKKYQEILQELEEGFRKLKIL